MEGRHAAYRRLSISALGPCLFPCEICALACPFEDSDRFELEEEETMKNTPPSQSISLYYREGNSDKVYHVQLVEVEGGCVVNFQYGRRGSTLQTGTKTATPVTRYEAEKTFS